MTKFFKEIKYHTTNFFAYLLIVISWIVMVYPLLYIIFSDKIKNSTYIIIYFISFFLGWIIYIIGATIRRENRKEHNKEDNTAF